MALLPLPGTGPVIATNFDRLLQAAFAGSDRPVESVISGPRPLLLTGHGLAEPEVEALVRLAHQDHRGVRSWAVVLNKTTTNIWRQCGVYILDRPVDQYVLELYRRIVQGGRGAAPVSTLL